MPEQQTLRRARRDKREGKSASTQAGEFVREEIHHIRQGKHGARNSRQAIAIGLSKARRAGVELAPPAEGRTSESTVRKARRDYARGHGASPQRKVTARRRRASEQALEREPRESASPRALANQARAAAGRLGPGERASAARKAAKTKGPAQRSSAARKAARTRGARRGSSMHA
ncbi:MAG TPA: hypothetical protein VN660_10500 [Steroidobacteraceae bacterium]|nr:hypothetical protein [Steroidobacteraceae bacterium]